MKPVTLYEASQATERDPRTLVAKRLTGVTPSLIACETKP